MKTRFLAATVMATSMAGTNMAVAQCDKNFQEVTVTGKVDTLVVSQSVQSGFIDLQLESVKTNKVLFDQRGAVVGQITGVDVTGFPIIVSLDHDITFDDGVRIETTGDQASVFGDPGGTYVPVVETLSTFSGTKNFRKATGEITATGFLNVPRADGFLHNEFDLTGSLCVKD